MSEREALLDVIERWVAGQASEQWDLDTLDGPLREVSSAMRELRRSAAADGVVRGRRTQRFVVTSLPSEAELATGAAVVEVDMPGHQEAATVTPGTVAAGAVAGVRPAAHPVRTSIDSTRTALRVRRGPHGWAITDLRERVRDEQRWFSSGFCTHGAALVLEPQPAPGAAPEPARAAGLSLQSLYVTGLSGWYVHTVRVSHGYGVPRVLVMSTEGGAEEGFLLGAHESRVVQLPKSAERSVAVRARLRPAEQRRFRPDRGREVLVVLTLPADHPCEGWCAR
ncbi:MAG: hypothetical protein JWO22_1135 [Frankiales bacterium]|nr:hypothetical protein [Frankiales bacterium]